MISPLVGVRRDYTWGSPTAIPQFMNQEPSGGPVAELWFGAHSTGSATAADGRSLRDWITAAPRDLLGDETVRLYGPELPYLLKLIAPVEPLSLQVHPNADQARRGFEAENLDSIAIDDPERKFRDPRHKPELVYALTPFEALCGFRAPRRVLELLAGLDAHLARILEKALHDADPQEGMRQAFSVALFAGLQEPNQVLDLVAACRSRPARDSPSPRIDRIVATLADQYPGDGGAVAPLLLNPVSLRPGQALFVPPGCLHAYLSGLAVEIMASSDNVARAGLTVKPVDAAAVVDLIDPVAAPPMRVAAEQHGVQQTFYAPVPDFELSVLDLPGPEPVKVRGRGPRILLGLQNRVQVRSTTGFECLGPGQAVFVPDIEGELMVAGPGRCAQAAIP